MQLWLLHLWQSLSCTKRSELPEKCIKQQNLQTCLYFSFFPSWSPSWLHSQHQTSTRTANPTYLGELIRDLHETSWILHARLECIFSGFMNKLFIQELCTQKPPPLKCVFSMFESMPSGEEQLHCCRRLISQRCWCRPPACYCCTCACVFLCDWGTVKSCWLGKLSPPPFWHNESFTLEKMMTDSMKIILKKHETPLKISYMIWNILFKI